MKRILRMIAAAVFAAALLAGCRASPEPPPSGSPSSPSASPSPSPSQSSPGKGETKMGMGVVISLSKSHEPSGSASPSASSSPGGMGNGLIEVDATVAAVILDKEGRIKKCAIDAVQAKINFDDKGTLLTPPETVFKTKNELGYDYGMKKASGIGKEWYEQAQAFAAYVEDKTPDEVKDIKVDEENRPIQPDLKASVTISVGGFMDAVEKAAGSAQESGASESDTLSLGIVTTMSKSTGAATDKPGLVQVDSTYAAVARDAGGKITGCVIDGSLSKISFTATGQILTDLSENPRTKSEMGEEYGMKKASGIGKEWKEQAEDFAKYCIDKTPEEIAGIAVDERGYALPQDLKSSVTVNIGEFKNVISKAASSQWRALPVFGIPGH